MATEPSGGDPSCQQKKTPSDCEITESTFCGECVLLQSTVRSGKTQQEAGLFARRSILTWESGHLQAQLEPCIRTIEAKNR